MTSDFAKAVDNAFKEFLTDGRFQVTDERYDEKSFGNAIVSLEGAAFTLVLVRDRGQIFADFGSMRGGGFFDSRLVRGFVEGRLRDSSEVELQELASFVAQHWSELQSAFAGPHAPATLARLEQMREDDSQLRWGTPQP